MTTLVELCSGTAAVSLWALARVRPLTGYMGSKRRDAANLVRALGIDAPERVVLVDGGPWGDVWTTLQHLEERRAVAAQLRAFDQRGPLPGLWDGLVSSPPAADPSMRAAQYLCIQATVVRCCAAWWDGDEWSVGCGPNRRGAAGRPKVRYDGVAQRHGIHRAATLAERVETLDRIDWTRVEVIHGDVGDIDPIPGSRVYFDPPYHGAPRYARLLPRAGVLEVAAAHAAVADLVVVSEAEALPLPGWHAYPLRPSGKPEWLTTSRPLEQYPVRQLALFEGAAA